MDKRAAPLALSVVVLVAAITGAARAPLPHAASAGGGGDATRGAALFAKLPCGSCHDVTHPLPGGDICPNLGNIAIEAARIIRGRDYHGRAKDVAGYIRESIVDPNAYIVPGPAYHQADGQSVMPKDFGQTLTPAQLDDLVAFLVTRQ